jgi:hypothetical protein
VRGRRAKIGIVSPASFLSESLMRRDKQTRNECTFFFHPHLRVCRHRADEGASGQRSRDNSRLRDWTIFREAGVGSSGRDTSDEESA